MNCIFAKVNETSRSGRIRLRRDYDFDELDTAGLGIGAIDFRPDRAALALLPYLLDDLPKLFGLYTGGFTSFQRDSIG
jgi:hypothetical protein